MNCFRLVEECLGEVQVTNGGQDQAVQVADAECQTIGAVQGDGRNVLVDDLTQSLVLLGSVGEDGDGGNLIIQSSGFSAT